MKNQDDIEVLKLISTINTEYFAGKTHLLSEDILKDIEKLKSKLPSNYLDRIDNETNRGFNNLNIELFYLE